MTDDIKKYQIYIDARPFSGSPTGIQIVQSDRTFSLFPENDFFLNVFLTRTHKVLGYVDTKRDEDVFPMERQLVNPYFIEYSFFDTIQRNKTNQGVDMSINMIDYLRDKFPRVSGYTDSDVVDWFDYEGKRRLTDDDLDDMDKLGLIWTNIISKANYFPIDINK